jgi:hypothetical protein
VPPAQCSPEHKLFCLYLVDCILKTNPPKEYFFRFSTVLLEVRECVIQTSHNLSTLGQVVFV